MIGLDGEKMSKSRGNLVFVSKLRSQRRRPERDPPRPARRALPQRPAVDGGPARPTRRSGSRRGGPRSRATRGPDGAALVAALRDRLADDLDTPGALAAVDAWAARREGDDATAPGLVRDAVDALLGVAL